MNTNNARNQKRQTRNQKRQTRKVSRALLNYGDSLAGRPSTKGIGAFVGLIFVLGCLFTIGKLVLVGFMVYWNVTDIVNVGPNFWNVFWLVLAAGILFSPTSVRTTS